MVDEPTRAAGEEPFERCDEQPQFVGPFRLLERIGAGGMGVVHLAERREPVAQRVALKVIRTDRLDRTYRARFAMEQDALARMDHPNIARLLDAGDSNGQSWFAMEFVPGQPLTDYCREHRLSVEQRLQLFVQICDGVQHAHIKGILHRDLKPGNILVREVDGRPVAKIIDFGLAQPVDPLQIRATLHEAVQQVVGTFAYMSPEQATRTEGDLDTRTDVYSLGAVLYELLTGELPLDLDDVKRRGLQWFGTFLREHEPPKPSTRLSALGERLPSTAAERATSAARLQSSVRGDLDWVTMKALARDRQRRYLTVRDLGREVERVLAHRPVEAGPPSAWYVARKWVRRHAVGVGVAGVLVVSATTLAAMSVAHEAESRRLQERAALAAEPLIAIGLLESAGMLGLGSRPDDIAGWLDRAYELSVHAPLHRQLSAQGGDGMVADYLEDTLPRLEAVCEEIEALQREVAWVQARMEEAAVAWRDCIADICGDPRYGLESLMPQYGLVPLGRDPVSRLFEFEVLDSRVTDPRLLKRVVRDDSGQLVLERSSAIVLVLLPGGVYRMGTDTDDPWIDPRVAKAERPAREVTVAPFFIGKFELTAEQFVGWEPDPSYWNARTFARAQMDLGPLKDVERTRMVRKRGLPVNDVSWSSAASRLVRLGLRLPTEEEWEYAARGGTTGPWSCASSEEELRKHANLADSWDGRPLPVQEVSGLHFTQHDGVVAVAPVGVFTPNPFGLHDMHGNVREWCAGSLRDYDPKAEAESPGTLLKRVVRGGSFASPIQDTRSATRKEYSMHAPVRDCGVRPARDLVGFRPR